MQKRRADKIEGLWYNDVKSCQNPDLQRKQWQILWQGGMA
jgi:hypothetical protein